MITYNIYPAPKKGKKQVSTISQVHSLVQIFAYIHIFLMYFFITLVLLFILFVFSKSSYYYLSEPHIKIIEKSSQKNLESSN